MYSTNSRFSSSVGCCGSASLGQPPSSSFAFAVRGLQSAWGRRSAHVYFFFWAHALSTIAAATRPTKMIAAGRPRPLPVSVFRVIFKNSFPLLQVAFHLVLIIVREKEVVGKIDFHPRAFADRDRGHLVQKTVHDLFARSRHADAETLANEVATSRRQDPARSKLGSAAEDAQGERGAEDFGVVVVYFVLERRRALLA